MEVLHEYQLQIILQNKNFGIVRGYEEKRREEGERRRGGAERESVCEKERVKGDGQGAEGDI